MSSYSITVAWEPDYLKLGNHTLYTAIRTLMFCLQLNVVLCTCYISDSFENTVSHYHGIITWSLYLQLIQITVATVNSQGLLYNDINTS